MISSELQPERFPPHKKKVAYPKVLHIDRHAGSHPLDLCLEYSLCYPSHSASSCETWPGNNTRSIGNLTLHPAVLSLGLLGLTDRVCKLHFKKASPANIHKTTVLFKEQCNTLKYPESDKEKSKRDK